MEHVILTGVGGYLGRHVAAQLLLAGYRVTGTVRSLATTGAIRDAVATVVDSQHLDFAVADLTRDDGWDGILRGADGLMHVASPFTLAEPKDEAEMIVPAVEGTTRVLLAAERAGVRRAVVTSSVLTLFMGRGSGTYGPEDWADTTVDVCAYPKSKTLAEQAAWRLAEGMRMELVTVLPGFVTGPSLGDGTAGASEQTVADMIAGRMPGVPDFGLTMVDVRDVARLHVAALSTPGAAGKRLIGSGEDAVPMAHLAATLRAAGYDKAPKRRLPSAVLRLAGRFDAQARSFVPYLGTHASADTSGTRAAVGWTAGPIEPGLLELAVQVRPAST
jgi:dihydroflavonol-4-reductase